MRRIHSILNFDRKLYFPLIIIYLLFTLSTGFIGFSFVNSQYTQKLKLVSNITGAVLSKEPAMEDILLAAIQDTAGQYTADGFAVLNKYGYREYLSIYDDSQYRDTLKFFRFFLSHHHSLLLPS